MNTDKQIEVEDSLFIPFTWRDETPGGQNLGVAEFRVCLKSVRGKLKEFWVTPWQQRRDEVWHCVANEYNDFYIHSHQGLRSVGAWLMFPCKEHKAMSLCVTVPRDAQYLEITPSGIGFWKTDFSEKPFTQVAEMLLSAYSYAGMEEDKELRETLIQLDGE